MSKTYLTAHKRIYGNDGIPTGRPGEKGLVSLVLEMRPLGTELPVSEQSKELHLIIKKSKCILDEDGIRELYKFLEIHPSWSK